MSAKPKSNKDSETSETSSQSPSSASASVPAPETSAKSLNVKNAEDAVKKVSDIEFVGNGDMFQLICKASSKSQGWMKSTKAMQIDKVGCVVQVTTQQGDNISEALTFVPQSKIVTDSQGNKRIASMQD